MTTVSQQELWDRYFSLNTKSLTGLILELGIGSGVRNTPYGSTATVVGVDISFERLKKRNIKTTTHEYAEHIMVADGHSFPFPPATFDALVVSFTFCSVRHVRRVADELFRVSKPKSTIVVIEHVRSMESTIGKVEDILSPIYALLSSNCHLNRNPLKDLSQSGFHFNDLRISSDLIVPWLFLFGYREI